MFTGIIQSKSLSAKLVKKSFGAELIVSVESGFTKKLKKGDSVAVNGVCLTVCSFSKKTIKFEIIHESLRLSNLVKNISGILIGFISIPLGIGGGSLMVPFMRTFGYDIRKSIGTAAAVGFLIAVTGTITMITGGKIIDNVNTPFSLGYINLLGFIVFVPVTMIMARLGAKAVYKIDKKILSKIFGTFLILVSIRSFLEYLSIN